MQKNNRDIANSSFKEQWRQRFERFASNQDDDAGIAGWSETGLKTRLRYFLRSWDVQRSGERWLDVGCGAGTYSRALVKAGKQVFAVDYSYPSLVKAREREYGAEQICWILGDATSLPLRDAEMDGILALGVSQALPDSKSLVSELARVVASEGEIWVDGLNQFCFPNAIEVWKRRLKGCPDHLRYESPAYMRSLLREAGIEDIKIIWMPMLPGRWYHLQSWVERLQFLFQLPIISHLFCHSFLICGRKK